MMMTAQLGLVAAMNKLLRAALDSSAGNRFGLSTHACLSTEKPRARAGYDKFVFASETTLPVHVQVILGPVSEPSASCLIADSCWIAAGEVKPFPYVYQRLAADESA